MSTEENAKQNNKEKDDEGSWAGCLVTLVVIIAAAWALIHFNPSEDKHRQVVNEAVAETYVDGYTLSNSAIKALYNLNYHSIGVLSWTSTKYHGKPKVVTVGMLGYVHPLFEIN